MRVLLGGGISAGFGLGLGLGFGLGRGVEVVGEFIQSLGPWRDEVG